MSGRDDGWRIHPDAQAAAGCLMIAVVAGVAVLIAAALYWVTR
jgi:hypothetical protein